MCMFVEFVIFETVFALISSRVIVKLIVWLFFFNPQIYELVYYVDPEVAASEQEKLEVARRRWQEAHDAKASRYQEEKLQVCTMHSRI